ncbi:MAG: thioredoxin fold domain-containing protein [Paludibacteraceae bacterium]|nr:thioredoxin fold domain-containing protein [Paludibacteraceae bacterium]
MRHLLPIILLAWVTLLPTQASAEVRYITTAQFKQQVFNYRTDTVWNFRGKRPCVVDFYTTWCGPCKRLAPVMDSLSIKYKGKVDFYKADTEEERELAYIFNITSIPQVLYVPKTGQPMLLKGLYPRENIEKIIEEFLLGKKAK